MGICGSKNAEPEQADRPLKVVTAKPAPEGHSETENGRGGAAVDPAEVGVGLGAAQLDPPINNLIQQSSSPAAHHPDDSLNSYSPAAHAGGVSASGSDGSTRSLSAAPVTLVEVSAIQLHDHAGAQLHSESICHVIATETEGETISCSADKSLSVYNWRTKSSTDKWSNHSKSVTRVCYGSKLRMVFSASRDTTIRQWRTHTFKEVSSFRGHTLPVTGLLLAPTAGSGASSAMLVSGARDYSLRLWSVETASQTAMKTLAKNVVTNLRWVAPSQNMDGNAFVGASIVASPAAAAGRSSIAGSSSHIVSSSSAGGDGGGDGARATTPPGGLAAEYGGGFDANCILQCSEDRLNGIRVWDVRSMDVVATFSTAGGSSSSAAAGSSSSSSGGASFLYHTMDAMSDPNDANYFVSVSNVHRSYGAPAPGDSVMSSGGESASSSGGGSGCYGELKLWDRRRASSNMSLGSGPSSGVEPVLTIHAHSDAINAVTYLPSAASNGRNSSFIATASKDRTLKVWDLSLSGESSRNVQVLSFKDRRFACEFTSLALNPRHASPDAIVCAMSNNPSAAAKAIGERGVSIGSATPGFVLYSAASNGSLAAWHWNPNNVKLQLLAHTKPIVGNQRA